MKKQILTLVAVASFGFAAQAQDATPSYGFSEGNILVEGSVGFSSKDDKAERVKENNFTFTPQVGYFLTDKFAAGLYLNFDHTKVDRKNANTVNKTDAFNLGVFGRYYFLEAGKRFKFYGQANVGFANVKNKLEAAGVSTTTKGSGFNLGLDLGVNYFVTEKIAVNFAFANILDYTTTKPKGGKAQNDFNLNLNKFNNPFDTPTFGLTFVF